MFFSLAAAFFFFFQTRQTLSPEFKFARIAIECPFYIRSTFLFALRPLRVYSNSSWVVLLANAEK
jgi:hypothetical protein